MRILLIGSLLPVYVADRYDGFRVYSNIFQVIRQQPVIGRNFTADDDVVGSEAVVMLGYGIWQRRYARWRAGYVRRTATSAGKASWISTVFAPICSKTVSL